MSPSLGGCPFLRSHAASGSPSLRRPARGLDWVGGACWPGGPLGTTWEGVALSGPRPVTQGGDGCELFSCRSRWEETGPGGEAAEERRPLEDVAMETRQEQKPNYHRAGAATWLNCKLQLGLWGGGAWDAGRGRGERG